jgi:primase-polymerase (primpol)-like protein
MAPGGPLAPLADFRQFVTYRLEPDVSRPGKTAKRPCYWRTGAIADAQDPANWTDYATAAEHVHLAHGVGFVFTESDPFSFVDIDGALIEGQWSPLALELCAQLDGCAVETSQSGKGLHLISRSTVPPHACKNVALSIELYHARRFVALTGYGARGSANCDRTEALGEIVSRYFPPNAAGSDFTEWTTEPVPEWSGPTDDDRLIAAALKNHSLVATSAPFKALWEADADVLAEHWPGDPYGASEADAALAARLAFWTGKDCQRIRTIMERSALVRPKWDRADYLPRTIIRACAYANEVATGWTQSPAAPVPASLDGVLFEGDSLIEAPRELVKDLLPLAGAVFLAGRSSAGKTFIAIALAIALASADG